MKKEGFYTLSGERVRIEGTPMKGGEGAVWVIEGNENLCAKIYYPSRRTEERHEKILAMINSPPGGSLVGNSRSRGASAIAWPVSALYDAPLPGGRFAGFIMPLIDRSLFRAAHLYYDPEDRVRLYQGSFSWRYLLTSAYNAAFVVDAVHESGHRIGDLSGSNLLIARTAAVAIIDCDSFQIRDTGSGRLFPTRVGTGEMLPPELFGCDLKDDACDRYHADLFALSVLIFRLLMGGVHPFQAAGRDVWDAPTTEEKIVKGIFPYVTGRKDISPPKYALPWEILPPVFRDLFVRCFVEGHKSPSRRPSASEWVDAIKCELSCLLQCRKNSNHWFGGHLSSCPWCGWAEQHGGRDLFQAPLQRVEPKGGEMEPARIVSPRLYLPERRITFSAGFRPGCLCERKFTVTNTGEGILSGTAEPNRPWIRITPARFMTPDSQEFIVSGDAEAAGAPEPGMRKEGAVLFRTNGGSLRVPVFLTLSSGEVPDAVACAPPSLHANPLALTFQNIKRGSAKRGTIHVENTGGALLLGRCTTNRAWLKLPVPAIGTDTCQEISVDIDSSLMDENFFQSGVIQVATNGGKLKIHVAVTIDQGEEER